MKVAGSGGRGLDNLEELHDVVCTPSRARHRHLHHTRPQTTTMPLRRIVLKFTLVSREYSVIHSFSITNYAS